MTVFFNHECEDGISFDYESLLTKVAEESAAVEHCPYPCEVHFTLTDNEGIRQINHEYRQLDMPTDVLSFPMLEYKAPADFSGLDKKECKPMYFNLESGELVLGEIIISVEKAREQSEEYGHSFERELAFLTAHSMLHLMGYDHMEDEDRVLMEKKQEDILQRLGITRE